MRSDLPWPLPRGGALPGVDPVEDLSLHILDVVENSIEAGADTVDILLEEDTAGDRLLLIIRDNGKGMDERTMKMVTDPFFTTKTVRRVGLGIPFLRQASQECDGDFSIHSAEGKGTTVSASFRHSHIDRKPLGDIGATIIVLIAGNPNIDFTFRYKKDGHSYELDTKEIREQLDDVPINSPEVLKLLKKDVERGLAAGADELEETYE